MTPAELESLAEATYLRAGLAPDAPVPPLYLAGELLGWDSLVAVDRLHAVAELDGERILVRAWERESLRGWHVARALARLLLLRADAAVTAAAVDSLAAALRTPRAAFVSIASETGPAFSDLAHAFQLSESAAALRYGETMQARIVLEAPSRPPRVRGGRRELKRPRILRLSDAPERVVRIYAAA